jgi:SAM-dependent methyltransferase
MIDLLKDLYRQILAVDNETPRVVAFVRRACAGIDHPVILDIGCGYGRSLRALRSVGLHALGIEINPQIVEQNRLDGLECLLPEEFRARGVSADVILMSHVVEHFEPRALLSFVDDYLACLRPGGFLVIVTPLMSDRFFDDFDHVRPYQPLGFQMVYGAGTAQVQFRGMHRLELVDLWFRRSPRGLAFARGHYIRSWTSPILKMINLGGALSFRVTGGLLGRTTGWLGLFKKI